MTVPHQRHHLSSRKDLGVSLPGICPAQGAVKGSRSRKAIAGARWRPAVAAAKGCEVGEFTLGLPAKLKASGTAAEVALRRSNLSAMRQARNGAVENILCRRDFRATALGSFFQTFSPVPPPNIGKGASSVLTTPCTGSAPWVACGWRGVLPGRAAAATTSHFNCCAAPSSRRVDTSVAPLWRAHPGKSATVGGAHSGKSATVGRARHNAHNVRV